MPIYKVEAYLPRCIESILAQTYTDYELILVDDGSPDNCGTICDTYAAQDDRIKVIHKENGGLSDARNAGLKIAAGEYIGFVDSDDYISPDMYQRLYERITETDSDIAACGVEMVWEDGTPSRPLTAPGTRVLDTGAAMEALLDESMLKQPVWYKLYRREIISDLPFPVGKYHEDAFWSYQAIARAKRVAVFDAPCYYYLQRTGSIMGNSYSYKRLDAIEAKIQQTGFIQQHFPALGAKAQTSLIFSCLYHGQLVLKHLSGMEKNSALIYLTETIKKYPLSSADYHNQSMTHKIWLHLAQYAFVPVCRLRNALGIGL